MSVQVKGSGTIGGLDEGLVVSGIVTSSTQINVGSNIKLGNAGVVTATSFVGSGANLTSLPSQVTIANNADNRIITGGSGVNLNGEATLTYNGSDTFELQPASATPAIFIGDSNRTGAGQGLAQFRGNWNGTTVARITFDSGDDTTNKDDGIIRFDTAPSGSLSEALRITSTGQLLFGLSSASNRFKNGNGNGATPKFQFETANVDEQNDISLTFGRNNAFGAEIILAKHRASTVGGHTVVQSGDRLGGINFAGADGTHFHPAALIQARVDGTPGTGDMPGRLEFLTTADGAATPSVRMTIKSDGNITSSGNLSVNNLPGRNLVINGAMQIAQRATSYQGVHNSSSTYYKTVDRMFRADALVNVNNTTFQHALTSSDTGPLEEGFRYSLMIRSEYQGSVNSSRFISFAYRMEAQDIATSGWNYNSPSSYITLSYWVNSSVSQNYYGHIRITDGTNYQYPFETGTLSANTWTKITKTIPGNSNLTINNDIGEGLRIDLSPYYGTDFTNNSVTLNAWGTQSNTAKTPDQTSTIFTTNQATIEFTGLQLEVGSIATPFDHQKISDELARCMRYYERQSVSDDNGGYATVCMGYRATSTRVVIQPVFRVYKRAPNATFEFNGPMRLYYQNNNAEQTINSWSAFQNSQFGTHGGYKVLDQSSGVGGADGYTFRMEGSGNTGAYIAFESELV